MGKRPRGKVTEKGAAYAEARGLSKNKVWGLTDSDVEGLEIIVDHTDEVIEKLGVAIGRALEAIGIRAQTDAAKLCPVDTGRLLNSITHTIDDGDKTAIVGTNVSYAIPVHV